MTTVQHTHYDDGKEATEDATDTFVTCVIASAYILPRVAEELEKRLCTLQLIIIKILFAITVV